ncbi:S41 family peptidase [Lewinella sp. W8]|uniref:S41 family peptidase n=1 Tax=Lewinella sp. W8 TaxID=2528208 RepID=UPI001067379A|nr:S41 family peptidase [Lewinella sp. W8]MTB51205.1 peptidase S41 [Lewinella sp. W8]
MLFRPLCSLLLCLLTAVLVAQTEPNYGFETFTEEGPTGWEVFGSEAYSHGLAAEAARSGKCSAFLAYDGDSPDFKAWAYTVPAEFGGEKIKLTGYLKTENVTDGFAGIWLRLDPGIAFDNMNDRGVTGTTDWQQFTIELDLVREVKSIVFGALLVGKGKVWVDDLELTIDGKPLAEAPEKDRYPAELDNAFSEGSEVNFPDLSISNVKDLALLTKVWGFLKYHHPAIGRGEHNWDADLFRFMPVYLEAIAKGKQTRDAALLGWITGLGEVAPCRNCQPVPDNAYLRPDHDWMTNSGLDEALVEKLQYLYQNRHQGAHYYVGMAPGIGNPDFKNERPYAEMTYPDAGYRFLALARYWNMIQYFFPYRHLMDRDWERVLEEYLPRFLNAEDELAYEMAAVGVIAEVKDTHANLWGGGDKIREHRGSNFSAAHVRFFEDQLVVTDFYHPERGAASGLKLGDVITHINGQTVPDIVANLRPFYPASNQPTRLRDIAADMLRSSASSLDVRVDRNGEYLTKTLDLYPRDSLNMFRWYRRGEGPSYRMLEDGIGYVTLARIQTEEVPKIKEAFAETDGIIIDIRNYPSAFMPFALSPWFIEEDTPFARFTAGSVDHPGLFVLGPNVTMPKPESTYRGKVVVLVNELSQSQAEYTAMSFRAGRDVTIVGSTTAAADGNVSRILLPGGLRTMISGIGVHYPNGRETQRIGIEPDILVRPTIEGTRAGRDELLERALQVIRGE